LTLVTGDSRFILSEATEGNQHPPEEPMRVTRVSPEARRLVAAAVAEQEADDLDVFLGAEENRSRGPVPVQVLTVEQLLELAYADEPFERCGQAFPDWNRGTRPPRGSWAPTTATSRRKSATTN
jgi:hypothetical protein